MKVLFKKHVVNVGHPWEIKEVKPWYAQNFLFPAWYAVEATPDVLRKVKQQDKKEDKHIRELIEKRHEIAESLNGKKIHFTLRTSANGKVFGWIGEKEIITVIKKEFKVDISKKHVSLPDGHLKKIGETFIYIKLWKDAMAKMTAVVDANS